MSGEASLVAKYKTPELLSPEEEAERQAAIDESKRLAEVVAGAGGTARKKIKAKNVKGKILVEMTSKTLRNFGPKGGDCLCDEKIKIIDEDIIGAGGLTGKTMPSTMTFKYQELIEAWSIPSRRTDAFGYTDVYFGWHSKLAAASEIGYSKTGNATLMLECFHCRRIHKILLKYTAPGKWPIVMVDPIEIWRSRGVNLGNKATRSALDQFAQRENMGLAKDGIEFIEHALKGMETVDAQLKPIKELVESLDLPGSGRDVKNLEDALRMLDSRAELAQKFFVMNWIFKALSFMGEYYHHTTDEAEKILRGNWRPPEWYFEGR